MTLSAAPQQRGAISISDYQRSDAPAFLVDGFLASTTTLVTGAPTAGKTTLVLHLADALLNHGEFLGRNTDRRPHVIRWCGTDPGHLDELKDAVEGLGWEREDRFLVAPDEDITAFADQDWRGLRADLITSGVTLLVVDNLWGLLRGRNSNLAHEVGPVLAELTAVAQRGIAVALIHHASRGEGEHRNTTGRGSGSPLIDAWARQTIAIARDGAERRVTLGGNRIAGEVLRLALSPTACQLVQDSSTAEPRRSRAELRLETEEAARSLARRFLTESPPEARASDAAAGRWVAQEGTFGVSDPGSGRTKIGDWRRRRGLLTKDPQSGLLVAGPALGDGRV